jgi:NAD(P)-dependent dehydrogenase (short-subunit alcohol dehydrogenase family)
MVGHPSLQGLTMPAPLLKDLDLSLEGRVAFVTGGGRGIGQAIAVALAKAGADVAVLARTAVELDQTVTMIEAQGRRAISIQASVANRGETDSAVRRVVEHLGRLDILVNAAGMQIRKPALEVTEHDWDQLISVNLRGVFFSCQAGARVMEAQGGGRIINITSLAAVIGLPMIAPYVASKGAVSQLTKALAVEWAGLGIRVNAIGPGRIMTEMTQDLFQDEDIRESLLRVIPQHRAGTAADLAGAAVFLASDASSYMTGQTIYVDGGWLASGGNPKQ